MKTLVMSAMTSTSLTIAIRSSMLRCHVVASGWWFSVLAIFVMALMYGGDGKKGGGNYFRKPTAYWFTGCKPTHGRTHQPTPKEEVRTITAGSGALKTRQAKSKTMTRDELEKKFIDHKSKNGICDEDRSMISADYARNFIADFILGKPAPNGVPQQGDLF